MQALILAAGFGTRLLPYSRHTPKPLFTLNQQPLLGLLIDRLQQYGFDTILINTHHGHDKIEDFLSRQTFTARVISRHEPQILGTGGAIGNMADLWGQEPLLVINADIVTDIDLARVYQYHRTHDFPVTLVMHDHERFNSVAIDGLGFISAFSTAGGGSQPTGARAFTGIHVMDPRVLDYITPGQATGIIHVYETMLQAGEKIKSLEVNGHYWEDIGTPETYRKAAMAHMAPLAFEQAFLKRPAMAPAFTPLRGDGSDRQWFRVRTAADSVIMVDHGIRCGPDQTLEVDAFTAIGRHLLVKGAAVPRIYLHDNFSGLVFLEDLGDLHLHDHVRGADRRGLTKIYRHVIDRWLHMALAGFEGFDPAWTYQSRAYDQGVILEKECRYFMEAFVQGYLGLDLRYEDLRADFEALADSALQQGFMGFMHRDLQSRNILLKNDRAFFIDFQGGRIGPLQYDLASLLIDPYAALAQDLQDELQDYAGDVFARRTGLGKQSLIQGYPCSALTRNLQILGAFAYLSRVKGKTYFEAFIPQALRTLDLRLNRWAGPSLPALQAAVRTIVKEVGHRHMKETHHG